MYVHKYNACTTFFVAFTTLFLQSKNETSNMYNPFIRSVLDESVKLHNWVRRIFKNKNFVNLFLEPLLGYFTKT